MDVLLESLALREYAFGLIDPTIVEFVPTELPTQALVPKRLQPSRHLMPLLLNLSHLSSETEKCLLSWFQDAVKYSHQPPITFFVKTCVDADEFARHWNIIQLAQPTPKRRFWLRLHDPRVMHQLLRIFNPVQRQRLFGRSQVFRYWLGERWITVSRNADEESRRHDFSTAFHGWDWHRIERIGLLNRAMLRAGVIDAVALTANADLGERLIERAVAYHGLTNQEDLVEFAARGLAINPNFDAHPTVARAVEMTVKNTEGAVLADYFSLVDEHIWKELGAFTNRSMEQHI